MSEFWAGVGAICAVLMVMGGLLAFFLRHIKLVVRDELVALSGIYVRGDVYAESKADFDRRLTHLEVVRDGR